MICDKCNENKEICKRVILFFCKPYKQEREVICLCQDCIDDECAKEDKFDYSIIGCDLDINFGGELFRTKQHPAKIKSAKMDND